MDPSSDVGDGSDRGAQRRGEEGRAAAGGSPGGWTSGAGTARRTSSGPRGTGGREEGRQLAVAAGVQGQQVGPAVDVLQGIEHRERAASPALAARSAKARAVRQRTPRKREAGSIRQPIR